MLDLVRVVQDLSKTRNLQEIIQIIREAARQATGADGATFVLKDQGYCFYADENAIGPLWKGQRFPLSSCVSGWAMINKKAVVIPDIFEDPRVPVEAYRPTFVKSLALVPIRLEDPIGAIGNYWAHEHRATSAELDMLQALADTVSVAIENIQPYSSLQNRVKELEIANKSKDELLLLLSHELRTPLNSIMGWAELLNTGTFSDEELREGLDAIHRNSRMQCRVIDSLLDSSSIVLGQFHVQKVEVDLEPVVADVVQGMQPIAKLKSQCFVYDSKIKTAIVTGDADRLQQAIFNLLDNAIKFTPSEGTISAELVQEGPSVVFRVRDSGEGIDLQENKDIFSNFSKRETHISRRFGGLGLGLMVTKHIVEAHSGSVQVSSKGVGQGSEFSISFPLHTNKFKLPEESAVKSLEH